MSTLKKADLLKVKQNGNALTKKVANVILDQGDTEDMEDFIKGVLNYGCASGMVGELIYYNDTAAFYQKYKREIQELLKETYDQTGYNSPTELFGNSWDSDDMFAEETQNQNLLAWFGFEETCRQIASELNLDY